MQVPDANNPVKKTENRKYVTFDGPADAVYIKTPERVALDVGTGTATQPFASLTQMQGLNGQRKISPAKQHAELQ